MGVRQERPHPRAEPAAPEALPPLLCLTATAKPDVLADIVKYFSSTLARQLNVFEGGPYGSATALGLHTHRHGRHWRTL
jgi:hypothetical protein